MDINRNLMTCRPLHMAIESKFLENIQFLLQLKQIDVNIQAEKGKNDKLDVHYC